MRGDGEYEKLKASAYQRGTEAKQCAEDEFIT